MKTCNTRVEDHTGYENRSHYHYEAQYPLFLLVVSLQIQLKWEKMDEKNKAGLLTHEIIYEYFAKLGETDSIKSRRLNAFLYSEKFEPKEFWDFVRELRLPLYP